MLLPLAGALRALMALVAALAMATSGGSLTASNGSTPSRSHPAIGRGPASASGATRARPQASAPTTSGTRLGTVVQGQATHYGPAGLGGNCMFPSVPANKYRVAAGPDLYAHGAACGGYLAVTSGGHTIRVKIDDQCPECGPGHIDLSDEAFAALAPLGRGIIP